MKNRKTSGHNDLISEVAHQLSSRFIPSTSMIKQRIEGLIDVSFSRFTLCTSFSLSIRDQKIFCENVESDMLMSLLSVNT